MGKDKRPFCCHQNFVPNVLSAPAWGYIHMVIHEKNVYKIGLQSNFFKPVTNGQIDKGFLLTWKICPQWIVCPCPGAIYIYKIIKNVFKIILQRDCFKTCNIWASDKGFLVSTFVPNGLSAPALGLYTCIKTLKYIPRPGVRWALTGPLVLWFTHLSL